MALPPIVALEIGTTTVRALVGEMRDDHEIIITGMGEAPSSGVRKGEVTDLENCVVCIKSALSMAEMVSKVAIADVHLAVSGCQIQSIVDRASTTIGEGGEVTHRHVEEVEELASATKLPPERALLHSLCMNYCIDDQAWVLNPEGMAATKLALDMLMVHGLRSRIQNLQTAVENVPMHVHDIAFSGVCAALSVLTTEQKKSGAIVIDIGGGTTNVAVFAGEVIGFAASIGVGGDHVTNDISLAFNVSTGTAELIKKEAGFATVDSRLGDETLPVPEELGFSSRPIKRKVLHTVINARMDEILRVVRKRIERERLLSHIGAGVVLTGGCARMKGMKELAERVFDLPCYIGRPIHVSGMGSALEGPDYAVCTGLIQYGFKRAEEDQLNEGVRGWLRRKFGWS